MATDPSEMGYRIAVEAFSTFCAAAGATLAEVSRDHPGALDEFLDSLRKKLELPESLTLEELTRLPDSRQLALSRLHQRFEENAYRAWNATS